jgi:NhaP-type Na+/H+ or K+/H+ antiporter
MINATAFIAAIGVIGLAAQWLAWRFRLPAIVLLLVAGLTVGPVTGWLPPAHVFGALINPLVAAAVSVILFEGGLTLDFSHLRDAGHAVRRIVLFAAPLMWGAIALASHYVAGLSWPTSAVMGGVLVVTGPTVVQPLLRNARVETRPASVLRWEAIVNDPIGALFAVIAFEGFSQFHAGRNLFVTAVLLGLQIFAAGALGYALGRAVSYTYRTVWVPEYLKVPLLFVVVLACFVLGNALLDEAGLAAVTVMGVTIGNSRIASLTEIRRFKEHAAVLLVSGVFVLLAANMNLRDLATIGWRPMVFGLALVVAIRPVIVMLTTLGSNLAWRERLFVGLVAPRGIVAVAMASVFGSALVGLGIRDGAQLTSIIFAVVIITVVLFGLITVPLARMLKLAAQSADGILIVGCNAWTIALASLLKDIELPVMIADRSWWRLSAARQADIPVYYGEILAEAAAYQIDRAKFAELIAATPGNSYNALVCTDLAPEFGREHVFQIGRMKSQEMDPNDIALTLGGRTLLKSGLDHDTLIERIAQGWTFRKTKLTEQFDFGAYSSGLSDDAEIIFALKPDGRVSFATINAEPDPGVGDLIVAFVSPKPS